MRPTDFKQHSLTPGALLAEAGVRAAASAARQPSRGHWFS